MAETPRDPSVWVVGSLNADLVTVVERLPNAGETLLASSFTRGAGGKGANQAVAAARAGASTAMVGAVGDDDDGRSLRVALEAAGVRTETLVVSDAPTGTAIVTVDSRGENTIVVAPGANRRVQPESVTEALTGVRARDVVVAQGEIPVAAIEAAARSARDAGARMVLNLAPVVPVDLTSMPLDVLVVNQHEARLLDPRDVPVADRAVHLAGATGASVVLTLGAEGALVVAGGELTQVPAVAVSQVVDTTGAGDAFVGALCAGLAADRSLTEAVEWGATAGAAAVATPGAQGTPGVQDTPAASVSASA